MPNIVIIFVPYCMLNIRFSRLVAAVGSRLCRVSQQSNTTARILHYKMLYLANVNICAGLFSMRYKRVFICASNAAECLGLSMCVVCMLCCTMLCYAVLCFSSFFFVFMLSYVLQWLCTLFGCREQYIQYWLSTVLYCIKLYVRKMLYVLLKYASASIRVHV